MKLFLYALLSIVIHPSLLWAADKSDGCGIANEVVPKKSMVGITSRGTTRGSYSATLDFTGTTFGKFGCAKHSIVQQDKAPLYFIEANYEYVLVDTAQGRGEYLQGLARSLGCQEKAYPTFSHEMKKNFSQIFSQNSYWGSLQEMKKVIHSDNTLKNLCSQVSA